MATNPSNLSRTGMKSSYYDPKKTAGPDFEKTKQGIMDASKQTGEALKAKYGAARRRLAGQQREGTRQIDKGLSRLEAIAGGTGGATEKARLTATKQIGQQAAEAEQGLTAGETESLAKLESQTQATMAQLDEAERQRAQQREQFKAQSDIQRDSLAAQIEFQWAEFDENLKTNWVNSLIALKEADFNDQKDWDYMFSAIEALGGMPSWSRTTSSGTRYQKDAVNELLGENVYDVYG
jgi:hypothetical protein